jgi:hypothetical protein
MLLNPHPPFVSRQEARSFPLYTWLGLAVMVVGEAMLYLGDYFATHFFTAMMWTGYILLIDGIIWKRGGHSLFKAQPRVWPMLALISTLSWIVFEVYNFALRNWQYVNLPPNAIERDFYYLWAFATITPALLQTAELLHTFQWFQGWRWPSIKITPFRAALSFVTGLAFAAIPPLTSPQLANALIPLVWVAFIFLFEPLNLMMGAPSLYKLIEEGRPARILQLLLGGLICGFIWETWNYQAVTHGGNGWYYFVAPIYHIYINGQDIKFGEMPILGFLGYPPFAWECYALYVWMKWGLQGQTLWQSS